MAATAAIVPAYFDAALVAKFYLNEPGRDAVRRLARHAGRVVTSGIAVAEVSAAFHRKFREGAVDRTAFKGLHGQFEHDVERGVRVPAVIGRLAPGHGEGGALRPHLLE